ARLVDETWERYFAVAAERGAIGRSSGRDRVHVGAALLEFRSVLAQLRHVVVAGDSAVVAQEEEDRRLAGDEFAKRCLRTVGPQEGDIRRALADSHAASLPLAARAPWAGAQPAEAAARESTVAVHGSLRSSHPGTNARMPASRSMCTSAS